jgi:hypothetical protein
VFAHAPLGKAGRKRQHDYVGDVERMREFFPDEKWDKLNVEEVAKRRQDFFEMTKEQRDFFMFGMLSVMDGGRMTKSRRLKKAPRKNSCFFYRFNHTTPISRDLFLTIHGVSRKYLANLKRQWKESGMKAREHGNKGKLFA